MSLRTAYNLSLYGGPPREFQQLSVHPTVFQAHFGHPSGRALIHFTGLFFSLAMAAQDALEAAVAFIATLLLAVDFACAGNVTNACKSAARRMSGDIMQCQGLAVVTARVTSSMDYANEHLDYKQALDPFFGDAACFFGDAAAGFFLRATAFAREAACVGDERRFFMHAVFTACRF